MNKPTSQLLVLVVLAVALFVFLPPNTALIALALATGLLVLIHWVSASRSPSGTTPPVEQSQWFVWLSDRWVGPYSVPELHQMAVSKLISKETNVLAEGAVIGLPLAGLDIAKEIFGEKPVERPSTGGVQSYDDVPWYRESSVNSIMVVLGLFSGLPLLFTVFVLLTGDIYYKRKDATGALERWSPGNKLIAIALLACWIITIVAVLKGWR